MIFFFFFLSDLDLNKDRVSETLGRSGAETYPLLRKFLKTRGNGRLEGTITAASSTSLKQKATRAVEKKSPLPLEFEKLCFVQHDNRTRNEILGFLLFPARSPFPPYKANEFTASGFDELKGLRKLGQDPGVWIFQRHWERWSLALPGGHCSRLQSNANTKQDT